MNTASKLWTENEIVELINKSDKAVTRAVIAIYERQTEDEQRVGDTRHHNNVGFNGSDAKFLSYCAEYVKNKNCNLSGKFLEKARKRIVKYRRQLVEIANGKVAANDSMSAIKTDIEWKNEFAKRELEQEQRAFESKWA